jgi:hypothetical protein
MVHGDAAETARIINVILSVNYITTRDILAILKIKIDRRSPFLHNIPHWLIINHNDPAGIGSE